LSAEIPTTEPDQLVAGDTWRWDPSFSDFDASAGDQLAYALRGPSDLDITWGTHVSANGTGFTVRVPAASTALTPGNYTLIGYVTNGSDRDTVVRKPVLVLANPVTAVGALSHDETVLAALDALIEGRATKDQEEVTINGRSLKRVPFRELLYLQGVYRTRVADAWDEDGEARTVEAYFGSPA